MLKKLKNANGFTLIEIVIVIVIIAILAAILVPNIVRWVDKAKISNVKAATEQIRSAVLSEAIEMYKDGVSIIGTTSDNTEIYDDNFWAAVSEKANITLHHNDSKDDGYTTFKIVSEKEVELTFVMSGHTATYKNNAWTVE